MNQIPDLVVISGANGSGKTSIFEAIRFFKALAGPYHQSEYNQILQEIKNDLGSLVRLGSTYTKIEIALELSEAEKSFIKVHIPNEQLTTELRNNLLTGSVIISNGSITYNIPTSMRTILQEYNPLGDIGTFEYVPSHRDMRADVQDYIRISPSEFEAEKLEKMINVREKFNKLKITLTKMQIFDSASTTPHRFLPEIRKFFKLFFYPKEFEGVNVDRRLNWEFPIRTPDGVHDIDFLSSGEKEILMTFANLLKLRNSSSIIFFDEPELHLNAAMERKLLHYLRKTSGEGNQLWLTTHSLEIIGNTPLESLYRMRIHSRTNENQIELCKDRTDRMELFKELGASIGIQLISKKIIFVEGDSDKAILERFYPEFGDKISFVVAKGANSVQQLAYAVGSIMDKASRDESFLMFRDRDFLNDEERRQILSKFDNRVFVLERRMIENLLLDYDVLVTVFDSLGIKGMSSASQMKESLKSIADELRDEAVMGLFKYRMDRPLRSIRTGLPSSFPNEEGVLKYFEERRSELLQAISTEAITKQIRECKEEIYSRWDNEWELLCNGKRLFEEIITRYLPRGVKMNREALMAMIVGEYVKRGRSIMGVNTVMSKHLTDIDKT